MIDRKMCTSDQKPLVSIVTVVFNGEKYLERTIKSVLSQSYCNIQYVIIDGGSTDGTLEIIRRYDACIDFWSSEPDSGIYDAMNKGLSRCRGKYIGIINSDDYYHRESIAAVVEKFSSSSADIVFGNVRFVDDRLGLEKIVSAELPSRSEKLQLNHVHPTVFVSRKEYKAVRFDEQYRMAADYKLLLELFLRKAEFGKIDQTLATMTAGGASSKMNWERVVIAIEILNSVAAAKVLVKSVFFYYPKLWTIKLAEVFGFAGSIKRRYGWSPFRGHDF